MPTVLSREDPLVPTRGTNLPTEIACYNLPYGGLGFASHVLTYYTIACLAYGRRPLWPFKQIKNGKYDLVLAGLAFLGGLIFSTITMVRCRNHWQLLVLGVWKFSMSLFNAIVGAHVAYKNFVEAGGQIGCGTTNQVGSGAGSQAGVQIDEKPIIRLEVFYWFAIYVPGMMAGFAGLMSLIAENWDASPKLRIVVVVFGVPALICVVLILGGVFLGNTNGCFAVTARWGLKILLPAFVILSVFFGDWAIGAMANNLAGIPTSDQGLYYVYWISKRFTMLSW